jgi:prolyl-tRNA editing enzyme YbaK/EbsC (Cys-tRNA(Pro) deacylase)
MSLVRPTFPKLPAADPLEHPELLTPPVLAALQALAATHPETAGTIGVAEIDPALSDTAALTEAYELPPDVSVNCVILAGKRNGEERCAAACIRADTKADINHKARTLMDVRKISFMAMDQAVERSGMEYGAITPVGVPADWRILLDRGAVDRGPAIIGSGVRRSKLILPGEVLALLPGAEVIDDLAIPA